MFTVNMAEASSNQWQGWTYRKWCACGWSDSWPQYSTDELSRCVFLHPLSHYPSFLGPTFLFQISWYTHTLNPILYLTVLLSLYQSLISHRYTFEGLLKSLQFIVMVTWTNKMAIHSIGSSFLSELWLKNNWILFNTIYLNMCWGNLAHKAFM